MSEPECELLISCVPGWGAPEALTTVLRRAHTCPAQALVEARTRAHHLTMPVLEHNIDLSSVPHRSGQSTDLEAKRKRAWERLTDEEKEWVLVAWDLTGMIPTAPAFREMSNASDRVLYVLVGTEESLTPGELSYLMIARWFRNIDPATARAKMAALVRNGFARSTVVGRTMATEPGLEKLEQMARPPERDRYDSRSSESSDRRDGYPDDRERPRSSGRDDHGAPSGPRRRERGGENRGSSRSSGDRGGYGAPRGPRRDGR